VRDEYYSKKFKKTVGEKKILIKKNYLIYLILYFYYLLTINVVLNKNISNLIFINFRYTTT